MGNPFEEVDKQKTITEHTSIILSYQRTGFLDREKAIKKYKDFNSTHSEYNAFVNTAGTITNTLISIDMAENEIIITNLKQQLLWLVGSEQLNSMGIKV